MWPFSKCKCPKVEEIQEAVKKELDNCECIEKCNLITTKELAEIHKKQHSTNLKNELDNLKKQLINSVKYQNFDKEGYITLNINKKYEKELIKELTNCGLKYKNRKIYTSKQIELNAKKSMREYIKINPATACREWSEYVDIWQRTHVGYNIQVIKPEDLK